MAIQDFTSGQVLTSTQMDNLQANDYNQTVSTKTANYVLVAADKGTRVVMNAAGATTITVNTSLFSAGDTLQLQNIGAGVCTVTAGTATVSSAGPLAIPQYGSGTLYFTSAGVAIYFPSAVTGATGALTKITSVTLNSASTVLSNVFSATYENYLVLGANLMQGGAGTPNLRFRLGAGTAHSFNETYYIPNSTGSVGSYGSSGNFFNVGQLDVTANNYQNNLTAYIRSPFLSFRTGFTCFNVGYDDQMRFCNGIETSQTSFTDLTISASNSATVTGSIQVYGYGL
jgi:hypothetical protein